MCKREQAGIVATIKESLINLTVIQYCIEEL